LLVTKPVPGTLQEGGAPFETTHWTVVLQAGNADSVEATRKALATFSEAYWPPLYTFVRRHGYPPADAQDLIQGFFVHLFEQNTLSRADREKGRLRTFLLGSLQNYLLKERERMRAIKRGGQHHFVSLDLHLPHAEAAMHATAHLTDAAHHRRQRSLDQTAQGGGWPELIKKSSELQVLAGPPRSAISGPRSLGSWPYSP